MKREGKAEHVNTEHGIVEFDKLDWSRLEFLWRMIDQGSYTKE
jgi:hypothetical protein